MRRRTATGAPTAGPRPEGPADPATQSPETPAPLPSWLPAALVGLAVLILAATVRTAGGLDHGLGDGPFANSRLLVVLPMGIVLVWIAVAFGKRRDQGFGVIGRAGAATVTLIGTITVVVGLALLGIGRPPAPPLNLGQDNPTGTISVSESPVTITTTVPPKPGDNSAALPIGLLFAAIALFVVVIALLSLIQAIRRPRLPGGAAAAGFSPLDETEELAEAVEAGSQALAYEGDAREAVIACYAAMEQAVQGFGFARPTADTPEDLLRRATEKGLVPAGPAGRLTDLFREARFSRHPVTDVQRGAARDALAAIAAHIQAVQNAAAEQAAAARQRAADALAAAGSARAAQDRAAR